jgi:hypothetical protein
MALGRPYADPPYEHSTRPYRSAEALSWRPLWATRLPKRLESAFLTAGRLSLLFGRTDTRAAEPIDRSLKSVHRSAYRQRGCGWLEGRILSRARRSTGGVTTRTPLMPKARIDEATFSLMAVR